MPALQPGDIVVDYSWARPDPALLVANGVKAVSRYIAGGAGNGKVLTVAERDALWAAGLGILLNWEQDAGGALGGAIVGKTHGEVATRLCEALEYPKVLPLAVSVDVGVAPSQLAQIADYFHGFKQTCSWDLTVYGGTYVGNYLVSAGYVDAVWKASASSWSNGGTNEHVYLEQHYGIRYPELAYLGDSIDHNTVRKPTPMWFGGEALLHDAAQIPATQGDDDMAWTIVDVKDTDVSLLVLLDNKGAGGVAKWLKTPEKRAAYVSLGCPVQSRTIGELANTTLVGALPTGDRFHEWTGAEFD